MTLKLDGSTLKRTEKDQSSYVAASLATNLWWFLPSIWRGPMGTLTTEIIVPMNSPSFCPTPGQFSHKDVIAGHIPKDSKSPALRRHTQSYQSDKPTKKNSYVSLKFQWTNQHLQMPVLWGMFFFLRIHPFHNDQFVVSNLKLVEGTICRDYELTPTIAGENHGFPVKSFPSKPWVFSQPQIGEPPMIDGW